jgi:hypothetical protein
VSCRTAGRRDELAARVYAYWHRAAVDALASAGRLLYGEHQAEHGFGHCGLGRANMIPSEENRDQYDDDADIIRELVSEHVQLHQNVIEIDEQTWAIHGHIAYDGDVIAATFSSANDAWAGLSHLQEIEGHHPG